MKSGITSIEKYRLYPVFCAIAAMVAAPSIWAQDREDDLALRSVRASSGIAWDNVTQGPAGNTQVVRQLKRSYPGAASDQPTEAPAAVINAEDAGQQALAFLGSNMNILLPDRMASKTGGSDMAIREVLANKNLGSYADRGTDFTVVVGQSFGGIPVFEAQCRISMTQYGEIWSVKNRFKALDNPPTNATLTADGALLAACQALGDDQATPEADAELFIYAPDKLVWRLNFLQPNFKEVLVDATSGAIVMSRKNVRNQEVIEAIPLEEAPSVKSEAAPAPSASSSEANDGKLLAESPLSNFDQALYEQRKLAKAAYLAALERGEVQQEYVPSAESVEPAPMEAGVGEVSGGMETFEGSFPGTYWFCGDENPTGGYVYWDDISCESYAGSWSAWCADINGPPDCTTYTNYQDAYMYIECEYQGTVAGGDNHLYHKRFIELEDNYDSYEYRIDGYIDNPGHGVAGTPDATWSFTMDYDSGGWSSASMSLGTDFDVCNYLRITFYFHSDYIITSGQGAYVDDIDFNASTGSAIYPYQYGFPFDLTVYLKDVDSVPVAPANTHFYAGGVAQWQTQTYRPNGAYIVHDRPERDPSCFIRGFAENGYVSIKDENSSMATCYDDGPTFSTANGLNSYTTTCYLDNSTGINAAEGGVAFVELMRAWDFVSDNYSYGRPLCTLQVDSASGPSCVGETIYIPNGRAVRDQGAPSASVNIDDTLNHEYGHAMQWKVYGDTWGRPAGCTCSNHGGTGNDCSHDAMTEGWANYFPVMLNNHINPSDTHYDWTASTNRRDLESNASTGTEERDEYTVAGVLFDLYDSVSDTGDALSGADAYIWTVMRYDNPGTFEEFFQDFISRYPGWADELEDICIAHNMDPDWLTLSRTSIDFGKSSTAQSFTIRRLGWYGNTGTPWNQPDWALSEGASWLTSISPSSGTTETETDTIWVYANRSGLSYGPHYAYVNVTPGHYGLTQYILCEIYQNEDNYEENDTLATAYVGFPELTWLNTVDDYATQTDNDYYRIYITSGYNRLQVECDFVDAEGDIDIAVYNSSGSLMAGSYSVTDDEFIDVVLPTSGEYYYIRAYYANAGNEYNLWWDDINYLDAPTSVSATDGSYTGYVYINWSPVLNATHYKVWRATSAAGAKTDVSGWISSASFYDSSATPGATYYYFVEAAAGSSGELDSAYSSYDTGWRALTAPSSISASDGTHLDKVSVTWSASTGASYYRLYRSDTPSGAKTAVSGWQASTSFDDTTATPGTTYYYHVVAAIDSSGSRASGYSAYSAGWRALTPVVGVAASDGTYTEKVRVTWNPVAGASWYLVARSEMAGGALTTLNIQEATSFDDSSAVPGVTYYYYIDAAIDSSGTHNSGFSAYNTGWRALAAPAGVSASDGTYADKVEVSWSPVTGASYYRLYRAETAGGTKTAISGWQSALEFDDTTAIVDVLYYYYVAAAIDSSGSRISGYSFYDTGWRAGLPWLDCVLTNGTNMCISWSPDVPGWVLQETVSLMTNWTDCASGTNNPVTIPLTNEAMFYRLRQE